MSEERLKITCEEMPDIFITDTTEEEVKKMGFYKVPEKLKKDFERYDENFFYHLNNHCFRAMQGDEVLGMMVLAPKHKKSKEGEVLYLDMIYVNKPYRRQHIGHFLFVVANALKMYILPNAFLIKSKSLLIKTVVGMF